MFGINGGELLILLLAVVLVVGPQRLPEYAEQLAGWVRSFRTFVRETKERVSDELGESGADVDWASLDPRRYDPRRIVREALLDADDGPARPRVAGRAFATGATGATAAGLSGGAGTGLSAGAGTGQDAARPFPPFDPDLT